VNDHESDQSILKQPIPAPESDQLLNLQEFDSSTLFQGKREILIHHAGEVYRLRITRNDRLILQK
jgi:hemin uptake protein HemP